MEPVQLGRGPLHVACSYGDLETAEQLLKVNIILYVLFILFYRLWSPVYSLNVVVLKFSCFPDNTIFAKSSKVMKIFYLNI